ncbi:uncharacterized protein ARMOST_07415 [Armillaria ostoyae]|uniref:Uncharacterized protein n=1 Tax=Armillaria ostoyae TaxID=47428 RepID=A0A284R5R7_ARMOS|nr:uncharacterized protein ARMOST_07415 [Armillaria ostoyae]
MSTLEDGEVAEQVDLQTNLPPWKLDRVHKTDYSGRTSVGGKATPGSSQMVELHDTPLSL